MRTPFYTKHRTPDARHCCNKPPLDLYRLTSALLAGHPWGRHDTHACCTRRMFSICRNALCLRHLLSDLESRETRVLTDLGIKAFTRYRKRIQCNSKGWKLYETISASYQRKIETQQAFTKRRIAWVLRAQMEWLSSYQVLEEGVSSRSDTQA